MEINDILSNMKERGLFPSGILRSKYKLSDIEYAKKVVIEIGKMRNKNFSIDNENNFAYENIIKWIHGDESMKCIDPDTGDIIPGNLNSGIYLAGNPGSGKSWCMEIMSDYCLIDNVKVKLDDNIRCLHWENIRADMICDEYVLTGNIRKYKDMGILCIQDLGSEPEESIYMGNRANVNKQLLENRGDHSNLITLITSNFSMTHTIFKKKYGDRVISRLHEMCNYIEMKGRDRRILNNK